MLIFLGVRAQLRNEADELAQIARQAAFCGERISPLPGSSSS